MAPSKESFRLSTQDASFLYGEAANGPLNMAMLGTFRSHIDFKSLRAYVDARMHLLPRYRQRLVFAPLNLAHPSLEDDPGFDLANHMFCHELPLDSSEAVLMKAVMQVYEKPLDRGKPLWELHLFTGLRGGHSAILTKIHHCLADGISGMELLAATTSTRPDAPAPTPPDEPWRAAPTPGRVERVASALTDLARSRIELARRAADAITNLRDLDEQASAPAAVVQTIRRMGQPIVAAPWNAATVTAARTVAWLRCPLHDVARIRTTFGGTINDVVLAILSEGAARYLAFHGCPTEGRPIRIGCPVNVRAKDEYGKLGNRVSMMFPEFDARTMNTVDRLKAVIEETSRIKAAKEALAFENLMSALDYVPPAALGLASRLLTSAIEVGGRLAGAAPRLARRAPMLGTGISFIATNIPGSPVPVYLAGHQLVDTVGMVPLTATLGYGVTILSYNRNLYLALTAEPNLMPDVGFMKSRIKETLRELIARVPKEIVPAAPSAVPASAAIREVA
ncbi:MAG: wax ester/triacylglycerol synthase family O-acyltransferase [Candidatus Binatus sp.]